MTVPNRARLAGFLAALAVFVATAAGPSPAAADTMLVTYTLDLTVSIPSLSTATSTISGAGVIRYAATGGVSGASTGTILHGPANLVTANASGPFMLSVPIGAFLSGQLTVSGNHTQGVLVSPGTLVLPATLVQGGHSHCSGPACANSLNLVPSIYNVLFQVTATVLTVPTATAGGNLLPTLSFPSFNLGTLAGAPMVATMVGTEVSRTYQVPEPDGRLGLGACVAALALLHHRHRRRLREGAR